MTIPNLPKWAIYGGGAVAAYLIWRAVTNPESLGAAVGSGAVSAVTGAVKGVGAGVKGAIDGAVQAATGDDSKTIGTAIYDFFHPNEGKNITEPVIIKKSGAGPMGAVNPVYEGATPGGDSFAVLAGGGF